MLRIEFVAMTTSGHISLPPAERYLVAGNFIRNAVNNTILARYANHVWHIGDRTFSRYETRGKAALYFEDGLGGTTERYGPFDKVIVTDGSLHDPDLLAARFIEETMLWRDCRTDTYWPKMFLETV